MDMLLNYLHLLATGLLIGKVVLLSFVVAPVMAKALDSESFGMSSRKRRLMVPPSGGLRRSYHSARLGLVSTRSSSL